MTMRVNVWTDGGLFSVFKSLPMESVQFTNIMPYLIFRVKKFMQQWSLIAFIG